MPFIITTKRPQGSYDTVTEKGRVRRAVATLEEAREDASNVVEAMYDALLAVGHQFGPKMRDLDFYGACERLTESGGTVGPLLDGTSIGVEPGPGQQQMREDLRVWGSSLDTRDALDDKISAAWVEAYNAKQATDA